MNQYRLMTLRFAQKVIPEFFYNKVRIWYYRLDRLLKHGNRFIAVEVETITACNKRCKYCPNSKYDRGLFKNKRYLEVDVFYKLINELSKIKFKGRLSPHFYGEPLLDERLPDLIRHARRLLEADIVIYTNGELLTLELYNQLVDAGVNAFEIAYSGPMHPNIARLADYAKNKEYNHIKINYRKFNDDIELYNRGGLIDHNKIVKLRSCNQPSDSIVIDCDGNVILCCNDYFSAVKFGNILNENLLDIWNKNNFRKLRKDLKRGIFELDICKKCTF